MDRHELTEKLRSVIGGYLESQGLELVELIYRQEGRDFVLRILADRPQGGITLDECAGLNIQISGLLDEKGILQERYILEVSSPGLDRPLKSREDFLRCTGRNARFFLNEPVNGKIEMDGVINKVDNNYVYIESGGKTVEIPLARINRAKQIIE